MEGTQKSYQRFGEGRTPVINIFPDESSGKAKDRVNPENRADIDSTHCAGFLESIAERMSLESGIENAQDSMFSSMSERGTGRKRSAR